MEDTLGNLRDSLQRSLEYLQRGFDLVMTYSELLDDVGHRYGPDSLEMKYTIGDVAKLLLGMFREMETRKLKDKVGRLVILTSVSNRHCFDIALSDWVAHARCKIFLCALNMRLGTFFCSGTKKFLDIYSVYNS